jgi:hypothetical protein
MVGVLGPFDAQGSDGPVRVTGQGERALLALLALSLDRPVAASTLIDELWEDDSPRTPARRRRWTPTRTSGGTLMTELVKRWTRVLGGVGRRLGAAAG